MPKNTIDEEASSIVFSIEDFNVSSIHRTTIFL